MAIQPLTLYNSAFLGLFNGTIDWANTTHVAAILCTATYTPLLTHATYADITNQVADVDYAPKVVGTRTISRNGDEIEFKSDPVNFGDTVTIEAQYLVLVAGDPANLLATDPVIGYVNFGESKSSTAAAFTFTPSVTGWFRVSRTPCP